MSIQKQYLKDKSPGVNWLNDKDADSYVHCPYGDCKNSVIIAWP